MNEGNFKSGCSEVNGLARYYAIYGQSKTLVLIHGGGSIAVATTWTAAQRRLRTERLRQ